MLHRSKSSIKLPSYETLKQFEGKGNYAIKRYYQFPTNIFYKHKLKMVVKLMDKNRIYRNILDFGSGPGIFTEELKRHALRVKQLEVGDAIDRRWKFDLVVAASVFEFCDVEKWSEIIHDWVSPNGQLIIASPMDSWKTRLYFNLIKDTNSRLDEDKIFAGLINKFKLDDSLYWHGLYFAARFIPK